MGSSFLTLCFSLNDNMIKVTKSFARAQTLSASSELILDCPTFAACWAPVWVHRKTWGKMQGSSRPYIED
jgi:hypothetical protein